MKQKNRLLILIAFVLALLTSACTKNFFDELADKEDEDAVYFQAQRELDDLNYGQAIILIQSLSADYQSRRDVSFTLASAFAGRCGLNFIDLANELQSASATGLFGLLMDAFPGGTDTKISDCVAAETVIQNLESDATLRTVDENLLMAFVSFAKIGVVINRYADTDDDGSPDGGFDHCSNTDLPETNVREVGTGVANAVISLGAAGSSVAGASLTSLTDLCAADPALADLCTITDKSLFDANGVKGIRAAIASTDFVGIGSCPSDVATCFLACP